MQYIMDTVLRRSPDHRGLVIKKEEIKRDVESTGDIEEDCKQDFALKIGNGRSYSDEIRDEKKRFSPQKDLVNDKQVPESIDIEKPSIEPGLMASSLSRKEQSDDQLESTKAEMGEVREENERLKMYLGKIMKDYQTLQVQFNNIVQQESAKKISKSIDRELSTTEETELVSLTLGSFLGTPKTNSKDDKHNIMINGKEMMVINKNNHEKKDDQEGLSLGLDYKYISEPSNKSGATDQGGPAVSNPSASSSFEERKEEAGETWPPSKALNKPAKRNSAEQDEVSQVQNPVKKARVCVRARCDTPTMNDGCQWRKYGQKIAKGNPCPRAYYRCTVAPSCPVRKQVQRCADDMSILITTYEGTHNHPLPVSATAMASTTSAAASMLLSGSSTSSSSSSRPADAHGFSTLDSSKWNHNNNKQFYLPNTSTYSSFQSSHPTITLDLTSTHPNNNNNTNSYPFLNKFASSATNNNNNNNYQNALQYPLTSLTFGSSDSNANNMSWNNYCASTQQPYNLKNQIMGTLGPGRQISTSFYQNPSNINTYQNYMQHKSNINTNPSSATTTTGTSHQVPDITIAAATKAITADPTFQSALAAALTSIIGAGGGGGGGVVGQGNNNNNILQGHEVAQNLKWTSTSDHQQQQVHFPASAGTTTIGNATNCASTFLNKTAGPATNAQPVAGSLMFLSSNSMSFSASKSASASPGDTREQTN